ncbi:hypothetical protein JCM10207_007741 [Rhodosporidiobolus poonsookiae]
MDFDNLRGYFEEEDDLDDLYALPSKKPAAHSPKGKKPAAKASKVVDIDSEDDAPPKPAKKKAAAAPAKAKPKASKAKKAADSEDDDDEALSPAPAPKARAARTTRAPAKSYKVEAPSDDEDSLGEESFMVEDDESEDFKFDDDDNE